MEVEANDERPDFSQPPVVIRRPYRRRHRYGLLWILVSAVISSAILLIITFDTAYLQSGLTSSHWYLQQPVWSLITKFLLGALVLLAFIRQLVIKPEHQKILFGVLMASTTILTVAFSFFNRNGYTAFNANSFFEHVLTFGITILIFELFGIGCNFVVRVAWESLPQFSTRPKATKKPPLQVASEAQELTEAEPTVSNQQSH